MLTTIDLFCGAGGLSEGFRKAGFRSLFANDFDTDSIETYKKNFLNDFVSTESILEIDPEKIRKSLNLKLGELDVLIGGPPCQGFSTYGKRDSNDKRNKLYLNYLEFLKTFKPKAFLIENVVGILSMDRGAVIADILNRVRKMGYSAKVTTLDAVNFGVPQTRKRVFVLGYLDGADVEFPIATHGLLEKSVNQPNLFESKSIQLLRHVITVKDAISDLPEVVLMPKETHLTIEYPKTNGLSKYQVDMRLSSKGIHHHSSKQMLVVRKLRLKLIKPGDYGNRLRERLRSGNLSEEIISDLLNNNQLMRDLNQCRAADRKTDIELRKMLKKSSVDINDLFKKLDSGGFANKYRRLEWNKPSHTLVAHMARDCSDFIHPEYDRFISVREAARLQSFPDKYYFTGSQFSQLKQIGNAVPPNLGYALAIKIKKTLSFNVGQNEYSKIG